MSSLSLDIKTSKDFFKKLLEDHKEFCSDKTSSRTALNCAMTAWHLSEWIYNEFNSQFPNETLSSFQDSIKKKCPSLQIMHDLANGTKHYLLTRHKPLIKDTRLHKGAYSNAFSRAFDISTLDIEKNDGTKIYFEDEIENVILFWKEFLQSNFNMMA